MIMAKEVWIVKGHVTNPDVWTESGQVATMGQVEWQFSDGPAGARGGSSDYLDLETGLREHSGYVMHWQADNAEWPFMARVVHIDGHEFADEESNLLPEGTFAPFWVFDSFLQDYPAGPFETREAAEHAGRDYCATLQDGTSLTLEGGAA
jgi:hypothetical protein